MELCRANEWDKSPLGSVPDLHLGTLKTATGLNGVAKVLEEEREELGVQRNSETVRNSLITVPPHQPPAHRSQGSTSAIEPQAGALGDWGRRGPAAPRRQRGSLGFCPPRPSCLAVAPASSSWSSIEPAGDREMTASATPGGSAAGAQSKLLTWTAAAHVTPRQITHGYAPVSGRGTRWAGPAGREGERRREFFTRTSQAGARRPPLPALLPLPTPCRSSGESAGLLSGPTPGSSCEIPPARRTRERAALLHYCSPSRFFCCS